jgi:hypothetical protein
METTNIKLSCTMTNKCNINSQIFKLIVRLLVIVRNKFTFHVHDGPQTKQNISLTARCSSDRRDSCRLHTCLGDGGLESVHWIYGMGAKFVQDFSM